MKNFLMKPFRLAFLSITLISVFSLYVVLDTFIFPKSIQIVTTLNNTDSETINEIIDEATISEYTYTDENISINISEVNEYDSVIYVADIQISDAAYLKTAFANNTYGLNIKDTTSETAEDNNAILAINGDYYGFREYGYVLRNGIVYRSESGDSDALVIDADGNFSIINESSTSISSLDTENILQILSFGPGLIENGKIVVSQTSSKKLNSENPRTAIGQISELHYVMVVVDGRTDESDGLTLTELADFMNDLGCVTAYNLDGGGSSTLYFNKEVINNPTDGRSNGERQVSDIVYIGY